MDSQVPTQPVALLDDVVELFWQRGFHDVCVEDIVRHTGLNRHTLYGKFGSKLGLFREALDHYAVRNIQAFDEVLVDGPSARASLAALLQLRDNDQHPFWSAVRTRGCLAARTVDELGREHPELKQPMDDVGRHLLTRVEELLRRGQAEGEINPRHSPPELAAVFVACFVAPLAWSGVRVQPEALLALLD